MSALCALSLCAPAASARPVTAEDIAALHPGAWQELAQARMHYFNIPDPGVKVQMIIFSTDLVESLLPTLAKEEGFPTDGKTQAAIVNALKPHARSVVIYVAARDLQADPSFWSPVFSVGRESFRIRLAASADLVPFDTQVVAPVGFHVLEERKPIEPGDAWRAMYELEFTSADELAQFMHTPGLLLEYKGPQKSVFLNIVAIRNELGLDADHPETGKVRPHTEISTFFDHFPPKEQGASDA